MDKISSGVLILRPPTGALPLDPSGGLLSPRPSIFDPSAKIYQIQHCLWRTRGRFLVLSIMSMKQLWMMSRQSFSAGSNTIFGSSARTATSITGLWTYWRSSNWAGSSLKSLPPYTHTATSITGLWTYWRSSNWAGSSLKSLPPYTHTYRNIQAHMDADKEMSEQKDNQTQKVHRQADIKTDIR